MVVRPLPASVSPCKTIVFPESNCTVESRICVDFCDITAFVRAKMSARCKVGIRTRPLGFRSITILSVYGALSHGQTPVICRKSSLYSFVQIHFRFGSFPAWPKRNHLFADMTCCFIAVLRPGCDLTSRHGLCCFHVLLRTKFDPEAAAASLPRCWSHVR